MKLRRFEQALVNLHSGQPDSAVFSYCQGDFNVISESPWVYWIRPAIRSLFKHLPNLGQVAHPRHGITTGDNGRFLRQWWEIGVNRIGFGCKDAEHAENSCKQWFPHMKGGSFRRWYGNQEYVVNYWRRGKEMIVGREEGSIPGHRHDNPEFYFRPGVTFTDLTSGKPSIRSMPTGFVFDHAGNCIFVAEDAAEATVEAMLGILNSKLAEYLLSLLNSTIHYYLGDFSRLPFLSHISPSHASHTKRCVQLAKADGHEDETTWDFIAPPAWVDGIGQVTKRYQRLAATEQWINEEVYRLYNISDEDRTAIEAELAEPPTNDANDEESEDSNADGEHIGMTTAALLTHAELACRWISYAVGIVMDRFQPGVGGALGRGHFSEEVAARLRALAGSDGILVLDQGHPDDLATKILQALRIMLGNEATAEVVASGTGRGGTLEEVLRHYFERTFFKAHIQKYRKRPIYWLLQSPHKNYGVWLFHEKLTKDTLYRIRGEQYVASKLKLLESHIADLRQQRDAAQGRERRALEKRMAELDDVLDDLRAFAERIDAILQRGYTPHIDDGVLINMAPLWELIPSWQAEPKKCWEALARGDYDWAHQAMDHWPERVRHKCETNKSYAIAHGLA